MATLIWVVQVGADWWFSNLHKWGMAPPTVAVLVARDESLLLGTEHVVPSWSYPNGLALGARWSGTRDYSAFLAVPAAIAFLNQWTPPSQGLSPTRTDTPFVPAAVRHNRDGIINSVGTCVCLFPVLVSSPVFHLAWRCGVIRWPCCKRRGEWAPFSRKDPSHRWEWLPFRRRCQSPTYLG